MSKITLREAADWCGGHVEPQFENVIFEGANNDSRKLQPGELFIALEGQRDGHEFIPMAMEKGAAAVLCRHCDPEIPAIVVDDPRIALGKIARGERNRRNYWVVGVTGSVGKSTTKEMLASILAMKYRTGKTPVNHNNDIGLPMTILGLPEDTEVAVLELGMNHFREMAYLSSIAQPDVAVITNIGTMHIEHLGTREGILKAKLEILEGLKPEGQVVFNGDEPLLWNQRGDAERSPLYFGLENPQCQVLGSDLEVGDGETRFMAHSEGLDFQVTLPMEGAHFAVDALAAISVGQIFMVPETDICKALSAFRSMEGRQEVLKEKGLTILKDCYNAGPESMAAALEVLKKQSGRRIAVLGDMLELGACTQAEHYRIGRLAVPSCDFVFTLGDNGDRVVSGAITGGMKPERAIACTNMEDLIEILRNRVKPGDTILVKGSRGMRMERVIDGLLAER